MPTSALQPAAEADKSTPELRYIPECKVIVCGGGCQVAIRGLDHHLLHAHGLKRRAKKDVLTRFAGLELVDPIEVQTPPQGLLPIPELEVKQGYRCKDCPYLIANLSNIKQHCNECHDWRVTEEDRTHWEPFKVQSFFKAHLTKFFIVPDVDVGTDVEDATDDDKESRDLEALKRQREEGLQRRREKLKRFAEHAERNQVTPWLRKTHWAEHFTDKELVPIAKLSRMPERGEKELKRMCDLVSAMFEDCVSSMRELPDEWRMWLRSPIPKEKGHMPLGRLQDKGSQERYIGYWKRFLCYCLRWARQEGEEGAVDTGVRFSEPQRATMDEIWETLRSGIRGEEEEDLFKQKLLGFCVEVIAHKLKYDIFDSPLLHFMGVLAVDERKGRFKGPEHFTYTLAGVIYCGRVMMTEHTFPKALREDKRPRLKKLKKMRRKYLVDDSFTPMSHLLDWLGFGKYLAKEVGSQVKCEWSEDDQTLLYNGKPIEMSRLREFLQELMMEAEDELWEGLMFAGSKEERFTLDLKSMRDNKRDASLGNSVISQNASLLGGEWVVHERLKGSRKGKEMLVGSKWKPVGVTKFRTKVEGFLGKLLVLIHITGGGPGRGDEITGLKHSDGVIRTRSVFLLDGDVMTVGGYHKLEHQTGSSRAVPRFLPPRVGQMLMIYLTYVRPFMDMANDAVKGPEASDFVWYDCNGPWDTEAMTRIMIRETSSRLGVRLTTQDWRHIAAEISRKHVRGLVQDVDDDEFEELYEENSAEDLQSSHTSQTAVNYGTNASLKLLRSAGPKAIDVFRPLTKRWHRFLEVLENVKRPRAESSTAEAEAKAKAKRHKALVLSPKKKKQQPKEDEAIVALRKLGYANERFKSEKQEEAVRAVLVGQSPILTVLPTGGGKSLTFMSLAAIKPDRTVIVVAPFVALAEDIVGKCRERGISSHEWISDEDGVTLAQVIVVAVERGVGDSFNAFAQSLQQQGRLQLIVLDECHLILTDSDYRRKLRELDRLRDIKCNTLLLSATLPPAMEEKLAEEMALGTRVKVVRAKTNRPNIQYSVETVENGGAMARVLELVSDRMDSMSDGRKGIIYCRTKAACKAMAKVIGCDHYFAGWEEREVGLSDWLKGKHKFIVATGALGTGVDYPGIVSVIHMNRPYKLIDFCQQSGRGGRGGEPVESMVVLEKLDLSPGWDEDEEGMSEFMQTEGCRRVVLSGEMDDEVVDCRAIDAVECDNCGRGFLCDLGPMLRREGVKRRSMCIERLAAAVRRMYGCCPVCWLLGGEDAASSHRFDGCPWFEFRRQYGESKEWIRYTDLKTCWGCHLPESIGMEHCQRSQDCMWKDIVAPVVLASLWVECLSGRIASLARRKFYSGDVKDVKEYCRWISRSTVMYKEDMTNAIGVFELAVEHLFDRGGKAEGVMPLEGPVAEFA
jgi:superfamily II DNA or RNA helicase